MKGKHYTEEQIIGILKTHEAGAKVGDLVRIRRIDCYTPAAGIPNSTPTPIGVLPTSVHDASPPWSCTARCTVSACPPASSHPVLSAQAG